MKRRGKDSRFGVISMCIGGYPTQMHVHTHKHLTELTAIILLCAGSGMGAAAVFERGDAVDELSNARMIHSNNYLSKDAM